MERFCKATEFAKKAMLDPERKAYYKEIADKSRRPPLRNAYTAAIKDYMNRPETLIEKAGQKVAKTIKPALKRGGDAVWKSVNKYRWPRRRNFEFIHKPQRRPRQIPGMPPAPRRS